MTTRTTRLSGLWMAGLLAMATPCAAAPIAAYEGQLIPNITFFGQVAEPSGTGTPNDDFWWFYANAGDAITITANRLEASLDTAFYLYFGVGGDTSSLAYLLMRDDNIAELPGYSGPYSDPQLLNWIATSTGYYTVQVWSYLSDSPGSDGVYDYQITLGTPPTAEVIPHQPGNGVQPIPEPATGILLGLGLLGLAALRRREG